MSSEDFKLASARASSKVFPEPSSNQKLQLYGLYKQATKGSGQDGKGRPGVMDPVGRAKFDAWAACGKYDQEQAKAEYINLVKTIDPSFTVGSVASPPAPPISPVSSPNITSSPNSSKKKGLPMSIKKIAVPKTTDLEDDQGFRFTVYNIKVTQSDGKVWIIGRRYNEVYDFYLALNSGWKNSKLKSFKFPNKSMLNTFSSKTVERRRTGFNDFFNILLELIQEGHEEPISGLASLLNVPPQWFANKGKGSSIDGGNGNGGGVSNSSSSSNTASSATTNVKTTSTTQSLPMTETQIEEQRLKRKKRVDSQKGFSISRFISTFIAVCVGIAASGGAGFFDLMSMDITRAGIGALLITLCAILLVDFMFMRSR